MSDQTIDIDIAINTSKSANSVNELKKSLKDLRNLTAGVEEGSEQFIKLSKAAGQAKDKISDLNQAISSQSGAPIENVAGSVSLLSGNLKNLNFTDATNNLKLLSSNVKGLDFKGLTEGVKGFGSTMVSLGKSLLANPLFLIAGVIVGIGAVLFALKDKVEIIGKAFKFFGDILDKITDSIGLTNVAVTKSVDDMVKKNDELTTSLKKNADNEAAIAQARGDSAKSIRDIHKKTNDDIIKSNDETINKLSANQKYLTDKQKEALDKAKKDKEDAIQANKVIEAQDYKESQDALNDDIKKKEEARKKAIEKYKSEEESLKETIKGIKRDLYANTLTEQQKEIYLVEQKYLDLENKARGHKDRLKEIEILKNQELEAVKLKQAEADKLRRQDNYKDQDDENRNFFDKQDAAFKKKKDDKIALAEKEAQQRIEIANLTADALGSIANLFFNANEKDRKKALINNRNAALIQLGIDTGRSIASLTAASAGNPANAVTAGGAGAIQYAAGLIQILGAIAKAKQIIQSSNTQINSLGGGSSFSDNKRATSTGAIGQNPSQQPTFVSPELQKIGSSNKIGQSQTEPIRAYVVSGDISQAQRKNEILERRATF